MRIGIAANHAEVAVQKPLTQALCQSGQQRWKECVIDRRRHTMTNYQYLIIGGGTTAAATMDGIRKVDSIGGIGLICAELDAPYDRPPLSNALWQGTPVDSIWRKTESRQAAAPDAEIPHQREIMPMKPACKVADPVRWNSEPGHVRGTNKEKVTPANTLKTYTVCISKEGCNI